MVSIAESLNYRIFERKWRSGEASIGHPRACRIAQCRTKTHLLPSCVHAQLGEAKRVSACARFSAWRGRVVTPSQPSKRRFMGNSIQSIRGARPFGGAPCDQQVKTRFLLVALRASKTLFSNSFVTDLSAAGSPAELKHITQRRKRKQP